MGMGECGAKYTTQNKTVWLFKRELEDSSSRLKILAKILQIGVHHGQ